MSKNQLHGKTYEDHLKSVFPGSSDHERSAGSAWDIEKQYDKILKLPTSIKTSKSKIIELADARKIWLLNEPYRLLVGKSPLGYLPGGVFAFWRRLAGDMARLWSWQAVRWLGGYGVNLLR